MSHTAPSTGPQGSLRLYNTMSRTVEDFVPLTAGKIGLYVCGMTVYDLSLIHI